MPWLTWKWGNPSSIHSPGREARRAVEKARQQVAELVGADPEQVLFTSGATEANNSALHSAIHQDPSRRHIVTSAVEHSAVLAYCDYLENQHGVHVTRLGVDSHGQLNLDELRAAIRPDTALVSLMWANNETGVIWPISVIGDICRNAGVSVHTDTVQAVGKLPVSFSDSAASYLSLSGHKFGAPKGIGALVVKDPENFVPLIYGGKQECGMRGGTESLPLIVALGAAAEIASLGSTIRWNIIEELRNRFEGSLIEKITGAEINGGGSVRLPNTSNVHLPGLDGDAMVTFLDQKGICVSSGSACLESTITPSHVIQAMTGSYERASESLRISLGLDSNTDEIRQLVEALEVFAESNA